MFGAGDYMDKEEHQNNVSLAKMPRPLLKIQDEEFGILESETNEKAK